MRLALAHLDWARKLQQTLAMRVFYFWGSVNDVAG
jgi:hypothetical protein